MRVDIIQLQNCLANKLTGQELILTWDRGIAAIVKALATRPLSTSVCCAGGSDQPSDQPSSTPSPPPTEPEPQSQGPVSTPARNQRLIIGTRPQQPIPRVHYWFNCLRQWECASAAQPVPLKDWSEDERGRDTDRYCSRKLFAMEVEYLNGLNSTRLVCLTPT
ncbi:hypothetical protein DFS34DRAFT_221471 [Phlyctochytrium arcticum]|nr:hypothetical protein DFS34DRAFT_221471 [Phlyctochytrium arcticum]